jgi:8-oxoguanine DNA glycosylase-like protein
LIGVLAWGYGVDRNGRARSAKSLTVQIEPPRTPFEVTADIVTITQTQGAQAGFSTLFNRSAGWLRQIGTAFGTKLLHFGAYHQAPGPPPLIYDENAWKAYAREPGNAGMNRPGCLESLRQTQAGSCPQSAAIFSE